MDLQTLIYLVVGATFVLYFILAIVARAGTTSEFYVAGKGINPVLNGMATAADWMSAASFISMAGLIAFNGYSASAYLMGWTGGYVLLAMLLAPYLRKFGKFTVPEFIGDRFYSKTARVIAVIALLVISLTYVIGQMKGVGVAFSRFLETSVEVGLFAGMGIVFVYAVLGGMKGITYTQIAQYVIMIFAYTVPAIFISLQLTGHFLPQLGTGAELTDGSNQYLLHKLDMVLVDLGFAEYTGTPDLMNTFLLTLALMIGTAGLPHVLVRFFTVPRVRDARKSAGWTLLFIAILYTTAPAVGAMAIWNTLKTVQPGAIGAEEGNLLYSERPQWFKNWETTGLLKFEDKNGDGRIQYYNDKNQDFASMAESEYGWEGNELYVDRDIMVLANPEIAKLPNWVIALIAAGGIAAALSTAAGLLLAISSAISHDLLKGVIKPDISEKGELMAGRISMTVAIIIAGYLGLNPPGFAAQVVALAFGLAASSLFPALMMGIFSKRMNKQGAIAGMLAGLTITLLYIFWYKGWFFIPGTNMLPDNADNWLLGINPTSFGAIGAAVNFIVAIVVAKMTTPPPAEIQELVEDVHQRDLCIGCGACVELCPYFKNYKGKTAQLFPCNLSRGRCFAYCPKVEVDLDALYQLKWNTPYDASPLGPYREVLSAKAGPHMAEGAYQGGGAVSALMALALKKGVIDAAVLTDRQGLTPVPRIVTEWTEVGRLAGSKFTAAPTLAGLNAAAKQGYKRLGVVGTPCQVTAVTQMLANPLEKEEHRVPVALAIGLFCNWSLDMRQLSDLLDRKLEIAGIRAMDIPPPPANIMSIETESGQVDIPLSEIKPLIPHTCFTCLDMTSELADLSVGMHEGRKNWNTLIVRSEEGGRLVDEAVAEGYLKTEPMPEATVEQLSKAAMAKKERSMRILLQRGLINTADGTRSVVRMSPAAAERILPTTK